MNSSINRVKDIVACKTKKLKAGGRTFYIKDIDVMNAEGELFTLTLYSDHKDNLKIIKGK